MVAGGFRWCEGELWGGAGDPPQDPAAGHTDIANSLDNLERVQYRLKDYAGAKASDEEVLTTAARPCPTAAPRSPVAWNTWQSC